MSEFFQETIERIERPAKNPFAKWKLKANPFPSLPVPQDPVTFCANQSAVIRELKESVDGTIRGERRAIVFSGMIGDGRSHLLKYCEYQVNKGLKERLLGVGVFVKDVGTGTKHIYEQFVEGQGVDFWLAVCSQVLIGKIGASKLLASYLRGRELESAQEQDVKEELKSLLPRLEDFLYQSTRMLELSRALSKLLSKKLEGREEESAAAWKFLSAKRLYAAEMRTLGIGVNEVNEDNAVAFFSGLLKTLRAVYQGVFVFIDELENVDRKFSGSPAMYRRVLMSLRRLLDALPEGVSIFFSCERESFVNIYVQDVALGRRITKVIEIESIAGHAEEYVLEYLNSKRTNKRPKKTIVPFTPDALDEIIKSVARAEGRCSIGNFLLGCFLILDDCSKRSPKPDTITAERVAEVLTPARWKQETPRLAIGIL